MTSTPVRKKVIMLVDEAVKNGAREIKACELIGISQRTLTRWRKNEAIENEGQDKRPICKRPEPKNKLSCEERKEILAIVNSAEFQSLPPSQIVPTLADQGIYIASESTIYRVMHEANEQNHRGKAKASTSKPKSTHCATGPNELWSWDITYCMRNVKGLYFYLYMIIDIYSRKIVGWEVWPEESAEHASTLIRKAVMGQHITNQAKPLVLHSDNGAPMKGATMLETLYQLGITPSRSRPRVSDDNPYSESLFKTCKYCPSYPAHGFEDITQVREWVKVFVHWYNTKHKHSGIKFLTPNERHQGKEDEILAKRHELYEKAKATHPERWTKGTRNWSLAKEVWLNPEKSQVNTEVVASLSGA